MWAAAEQILEGEADPPAVGEALVPRYQQFFDELGLFLESTKPAATLLSDFDENELNRYCIVLAELEKVFRAGYRESSLLLRPQQQGRGRLTDFVEWDWTDDLTRLSREFYRKCGHLLTLPFVLNPVFEGSKDVGGADADLIVDGTLLEIKTTIKQEIGQEWIWQLLGYALLDYNDQFGIADIGVYMARQGLCFQWDLEEALEVMSGESNVHIEELRLLFREAVKA